MLNPHSSHGTPLLYFNSLNRPFTVMGVERSLFFLILGICLPLAFSGRLRPMADAIGVGLFIVLHTLGVLVTRIDPNIIALYRRHIQYRRYYAPVTGIHASFSRLKPSVPIYQGQKGVI
jgi:type IV secretion system protein TrbD